MNDAARDLEDHLIETSEPDARPSSEGDFRITDESGATWALRKITQKQRLIAEHVALAEKERARIDRWLGEVNGPLESDADYLEALLVEYHAGVLAGDGARRTIKLPTGTLKARKAPDKVEVNTDAFLPWAKREHPELVRVKEEPDKPALKKLLVPDAPDGKPIDSTTGELIPGVVIERGDIRYSIEVPMPEEKTEGGDAQ